VHENKHANLNQEKAEQRSFYILVLYKQKWHAKPTTLYISREPRIFTENQVVFMKWASRAAAGLLIWLLKAHPRIE
jgi:hypothetical protein